MADGEGGFWGKKKGLLAIYELNPSFGRQTKQIEFNTKYKLIERVIILFTYLPLDQTPMAGLH